MREEERKKKEEGEKKPRPAKDQGDSFSSVEKCDICGAPMIQIRCELLCTNCGYRRDCTDT